MAPREPMPARGAVEAYFHELAATLDDLIVVGETYLARFSGEASDFVRMNRGRVRQPGSVIHAKRVIFARSASAGSPIHTRKFTRSRTRASY